MKKYLIFMLLFYCFAPYQAQAIDPKIKQKYPYVLLTDDYNILNENDLASYTWDVAPYRHFAPPYKNLYAFNYWQCFPRGNVSVSLNDTGYSNEDIGSKNTFGTLEINAHFEDGIIHEYGERRLFAVNDDVKDFVRRYKLMQEEKYVCLAGSFVNIKEQVLNGKKMTTYHWIFDKIKTKKGCDSYFGGECTMTYEQYKKINKIG